MAGLASGWQGTCGKGVGETVGQTARSEDCASQSQGTMCRMQHAIGFLPHWKNISVSAMTTLKEIC